MAYDFGNYRRESGYSEQSITIQDHHINRFTGWCINQNITLENITYNEVLQFIDGERQRGILNQSIINAINAIRLYFDYLHSGGIIERNIINRIKIRRSATKALPETLTPQQLENVYQNFVTLPEWEHRNTRAKALHKRNVVLLGLLVYQGLTSGEIAKLESSHINLMEGKIYIPATRKSNARTLKLQANQILPIKNYMEELHVTSYKLQKIAQNLYLFPTKKQSDMICNIIKQIKKLDHKINDSRQLRASVIMNWLKTNNIRQVQYMAGHRSIRSTEQYRSQDLTDLSVQLELFHPLRG